LLHVVEQSTTRCRYVQRDDKIHQITFLATDRAAVADFIQFYHQALEWGRAHPDEIVRLLVDFRVGVTPLSYTLNEIMKYLKAYPPQVKGIRSAYLYESSTLMSVVKAFLNTLRLNAKRNFLQGDREAEAVAWLLAE
jgi:hypothetical protein